MRMCRHCKEKPGAVYTDSHGVQKRKPYCVVCYKNGASNRDAIGTTAGCVHRPGGLVPTGFLVDDNFNELIHPDGRREYPVPDDIRYPNYFFKTYNKPEGTLLVLADSNKVDTLPAGI